MYVLIYMESKNNNQGLRDWWLPEMGMGGCGLREMSEGVHQGLNPSPQP